MMQAGRVILAIDSSKFGRRALVRLGHLDEVGHSRLRRLSYRQAAEGG